MHMKIEKYFNFRITSGTDMARMRDGEEKEKKSLMSSKCMFCYSFIMLDGWKVCILGWMAPISQQHKSEKCADLSFFVVVVVRFAEQQAKASSSLTIKLPFSYMFFSRNRNHKKNIIFAIFGSKCVTVFKIDANAMHKMV